MHRYFLLSLRWEIADRDRVTGSALEHQEVRSPSLESDVEALAGQFVAGALVAVIAQLVGQPPGSSGEVAPRQAYAALGSGRRQVDRHQMARVRVRPAPSNEMVVRVVVVGRAPAFAQTPVAASQLRAGNRAQQTLIEGAQIAVGLAGRAWAKLSRCWVLWLRSRSLWSPSDWSVTGTPDRGTLRRLAPSRRSLVSSFAILRRPQTLQDRSLPSRSGTR